jgi:uncharacterized membrane protein YhaH (DUF805 family)
LKMICSNVQRLEDIGKEWHEGIGTMWQFLQYVATMMYATAINSPFVEVLELCYFDIPL